jgi:hypothetical protein
MKTFAIAQFSILAVISGVVTGLTFFTGGMAAYHWNEILGDGRAKLPMVTVLSTHYGYLVPLICCLSSIICVVVSKKRPGDLNLLWRLFTLIVIIELISLALFSWFNLCPTLRITYRLM